MSFVVNYTKTSANPPACPIAYEKHFLTMRAALNFCVELDDLGYRVADLVQFIRGIEDGVLEGPALAVAVDRQRARIGAG